MKRVTQLRVVCGVLFVLTLARVAAGGQDQPTTHRGGLAIDLVATVDGPPPPVPPAVVSRDEAGRPTVRAVRVTAPIDIDGQLDDDVYSEVRAISDFIQNDPNEGAPASEKTEIWVLFDDENVYVSGRAWESQPDRMMVTEMRRDNSNIGRNDNVAWSFDSFYDRRNGTMWEINALGGRMDGQTTNDGQTNWSWNPVWQVEVGRFDGGWSFEAAIPFKSLRYRPGPSQIWGFNVRRRNIWRNENSYIGPLPASLGARGLRPATLVPLVGLQAPPGSKNLEVKPFAIADLTTDTAEMPPLSNDFGGDVGLDVKYGLTQNLTADFTLNTDFAQVEADEQQVNLTRFGLFFPEKREFFLENRRTFEFGGEGGDSPILFHSRRIGIQDGREVPVQGGGRLTGRVGQFDLGVVYMRTDDEAVSGAAPTDFTVVRVNRDILRSSSIGVLMTRRSQSLEGPGANATYGIDGGFSFLENQLVFDTYWAQTDTPGVAGKDTSYKANMSYDGDRYGLDFERLVIGDAFNPEVGFVRRKDMARNLGRVRFSPRLLSVSSIRKLSWSGGVDYIENVQGRLETRVSDFEFAVEMENSDDYSVGYASSYEFLPEPFEIAPGIVLPVRGYDFGTWKGEFRFGEQRRVTGRVVAEHGTFFNGHKTALTLSRSRLKVRPQFAIEPTYSVNWVDLEEGSFTTHLAGARVIYTMTPLMFVSALLQYNSSNNTVDANIRFRWEYMPGSELFVVYNEQRDTVTRRFPDIENRALIVKITRLFRF